VELNNELGNHASPEEGVLQFLVIVIVSPQGGYKDVK